MESLSDTKWDVVISGTGLQQSLLALALSRSGKNILHLDPNDYYGGSEAAFSLDEADEWAERHRSTDGPGCFVAAEAKRDADRLSSRGYSLALAPQIIHARSQLLSQLVSSKAFRQIEFLAVGSFYIYQPAADPSSSPSLSRIPSTREDVFSNEAIPAKAKRSLMKFLKFVLDYTSEPQAEVWKPLAEAPLTVLLANHFKLDSNLQSYIITLTLSHDGKITVEAGLATIHRHLTSMGVFGAGFAAVYPKWGGLAEIAQVGCRAAAVGGAVYMLGTGVKKVDVSSGELLLAITLTNNMVVSSKYLTQNSDGTADDELSLSRLIAVVNSTLPQFFEITVEGAPSPAVGVVAFPPGTALDAGGTVSDFPVYGMIHSSDTSECPPGQCVVYLSTVAGAQSKQYLGKALASLLAVSADGAESATPLYQLYYEQKVGPPAVHVEKNVVSFRGAAPGLTFDDSLLELVRRAWENVSDSAIESSVAYMQFDDREQAEDDDYET
ncbi:hypothetical protein S40285_01380 [Stachybotrys chlorohalonatus IBT 40285]|uniref:Rab proteins geranylgeranyltransferase n=1 Tax=Stachybotrys chlorohalonatus (strain IBT 40285) TaxID=1283841 RepID=A0A084QLB5_STAC4|nr:hypothetical protein S40285_01380 [Stachybotrys chlorohalonata IBT 40285]